MAVAVRALGAGASGTGPGSGFGASITLPAGILTGDLVMVVVAATGYDGPAPTITAANALAQTFNRNIYRRNLTRGTPSHTLGVYTLPDAAAAVSGQVVTFTLASGSWGSFTGRAVVFAAPISISAALDGDSGATGTTNVDVPNLMSADEVITIANQMGMAMASAAPTFTTAANIVGQYSHAQESYYGSGHIITLGAAGAVPIASNRTGTAAYAQIGMSSVPPPGAANTHRLAASGAIGARAGVAAQDSIRIRAAVGGTIVKYYGNNPWTITLPAGIQDGDTLILSVLCAGQYSSVARSVIAEANGFGRWAPLFNTPGAGASSDAMAAWACHNAQASMSGTTMGINITAGGYEDSCTYEVLVLTPSRVVNKASPASGGTTVTDVTVGGIITGGDIEMSLAIVGAQNTVNGGADAPRFQTAASLALFEQPWTGGRGTHTNLAIAWMRDLSVPSATFTAAPPAQARYAITGQIALSSTPQPAKSGNAPMTASGTVRAGGYRGIAVRATGTLLVNSYVPGSTFTVPIPAGVQTGDTVILVVQAAGYQSAAMPVLTATGPYTPLCAELVNAPNLGRALPSHALGVWMKSAAPASWSSQAFSLTVTGPNTLISAQVVVLAQTAWPLSVNVTDGGATTGTAMTVPDTAGVRKPDQVLSAAALMTGALNTTAVTSIANTILSQGGYNGGGSWAGSYHLLSVGGAGPVPVTSSQPVTAVTAQIGLAAAPRGAANKHALGASGAIGGARGAKTPPPALPVRAIGTLLSAYYNSGDTMSVAIPAGVQAGDAVILIAQAATYQGATLPTLAASGTYTPQCTQVLNVQNLGRAYPTHTLGVWIMAAAPASWSGQTMTVVVSGGYTVTSAQVIVLAKTARILSSTITSSGPATATTIPVPDTAAPAAEQVLSVAALMTAAFNVIASTSASNVMLSKGGYNGGASWSGSYHLLSSGVPGSVTFFTDQPATAISGQISLAVAPTRQAPLIAGGSIGGARGVKYVPPVPRAVSTSVSGQLTPYPGNVSINVPAGVVNGDMIILVADAIATGAGPSIVAAGTGALATFTQVIDRRSATRGQCLSVFVLRGADASLAGQALTVRGDCTSGNLYHLLQVFVLRGSDYLIGSGTSDTGAVQSATVTVPNLIPGTPAQTILNIAALKTDSTAGAFTGPAILGQAQYGSMGHMLAAAPVPAAYQYTTVTAGSTATAQIGLTSVKPGGAELAATGTITASGVRRLWPVQLRALGTASYANNYGSTGITAPIPAGVVTGDLVVVVAAISTANYGIPAITATGSLLQFNRVLSATNSGRGADTHTVAVFVAPYAAASLGGTSITATVSSSGMYYWYYLQALVFKGPARVGPFVSQLSGATYSTDIGIPDLLGASAADMLLQITGAMSQAKTPGAAPTVAGGSPSAAQLGQYNSAGSVNDYTGAAVISMALDKGAYPYTYTVSASKISAQLAMAAQPPVGADRFHTLGSSGTLSGRGARGTSGVHKGTLTGQPILRQTAAKMIWPIAPRAFTAASLGWNGSTITDSVTIPASLQAGDMVLVLAASACGVTSVPIITAGTGVIQAFSPVVNVTNTGRGANTHTLAAFVMPYAPASMAGAAATVVFSGVAARSSLLQVFVFKGPVRFAGRGSITSGATTSTDTGIPDLLSPATADMVINLAGVMSSALAAGNAVFNLGGPTGAIFAQASYYVGAPYYTNAMMAGVATTPGAYPYTNTVPVSLVAAQLAFAVGTATGADRTHPLTGSGTIGGRGTKGGKNAKGYAVGSGTVGARQGVKRIAAYAPRALGTAYAYTGAAAAMTHNVPIPAGVQDGDTLFVVISVAAAAGGYSPTLTCSAWGTVFNIAVPYPGTANIGYSVAMFMLSGPASASMSGGTIQVSHAGSYNGTNGTKVRGQVVVLPGRRAVTSTVQSQGAVTTDTISIIGDLAAEMLLPVFYASAENSTTVPVPVPGADSGTFLQNQAGERSVTATGWLPAPDRPAVYTLGAPARTVSGRLTFVAVAPGDDAAANGRLVTTGSITARGGKTPGGVHKGLLVAGGAATARQGSKRETAIAIRKVGAVMERRSFQGGGVTPTIPAGVLQDDTLVLFVTADKQSAGGSLTLAASAAMTTQGWVQAANVQNNVGGVPFTAAIWALTNAPAGLSGMLNVNVTVVGGGSWQATGLIIAFAKCGVRAAGFASQEDVVQTLAEVVNIDRQGDVVLPIVDAAPLTRTAVTWKSPVSILSTQTSAAGYYDSSLLVGWLLDPNLQALYDPTPDVRTITGQVVLSVFTGPQLGFTNLHKLTASATIGGGRGYRGITGRKGTLVGVGVLTGRAGARREWPIPIRLLGAPQSVVDYKGYQEIDIPEGVVDGDLIVVVLAASALAGDPTPDPTPVIAPAAGGVGLKASSARAVDVINVGRGPSGHRLMVLAMSNVAAWVGGGTGFVRVSGFDEYYVFQSQVIVFQGPARVEAAVATSTGAMASADTDVPDLLVDTVCDQVLNVMGVMSRDVNVAAGAGSFTPDNAAAGAFIGQSLHKGGASSYAAALMVSQGVDTIAYPYTFPVLATALTGQLGLTAQVGPDSGVTEFWHRLKTGGFVRSSGGSGHYGTGRGTLKSGGTVRAGGAAAGTGDDYSHQGAIAATATLAGRGRKNMAAPRGALAGLGDVVGTGRKLTGPGAGTLTGAVGVTVHTAGHGGATGGCGLTAGGWLTGRHPPKAARWMGGLLGWGYIYSGHGARDRIYHGALHAGAFMRCIGRGERNGGLVGFGTLTGSGRADVFTAEASGRLDGSGQITDGTGTSDRFGQAELITTGTAATTGITARHGQGELIGDALIVQTWFTSRFGAGEGLTGSGDVGGEFGYQRGGYAAPLIGIASLSRGLRQETPLPAGPRSSGFDEPGPQRRASAT